MAAPAAQIRVWVGDPDRPGEDEAWCPNCQVSSVVQVPYYSHMASVEIASMLLNGEHIACFKRLQCANGCGYRVDIAI